MVKIRFSSLAATGQSASLSSCKPVSRRCIQQHSSAPQRGRCTCGVFPPEMLTLAATDPGAIQDVIVGGSVAAAVGAALISGLQKEPTPCELCQGTGGIKCFACEGEGNSQKKREKMEGMRPAGGKRDFVGRVQNSRACRVCGGTGLVLCSQCRGSGYTTKL